MAGQRRLRARIAEALSGLLLSAPAAFLMVGLLIGPVVAVIVISFTDYELGAPGWEFTGTANYEEMLESRLFWKSIINTVLYVAIVVPVSVLLALGTALLIETTGVWRAFYRAVFFLPVMATLIAMSLAWLVVLNPEFGLLNKLIALAGLPAQNWLGDPALAIYSLCAIGIWQMLGFNLVLFLAGLSGIPAPLYDAAEVDGVPTAMDRFLTVTWPMLGPVTLFVVVISAIRSFQVFDTVEVLTRGGPNRTTEVLVYSIYSESFEFFRTSYAAALAVVFILLIFALSALKLWLLDRRIHYG